MNTKTLLAAAAILTLAGSAFATDALLSPRAQGNQIKMAASAPAAAITIDYVSSVRPLSPRLQAAQPKIVKGLASDRNPALDCVRNMDGTPHAAAACSQSVTMPGCMKLASAK